MHIIRIPNCFSVRNNNDEIIAGTYYGESAPLKEAAALEAAELLKAFFEAKEAKPDATFKLVRTDVISHDAAAQAILGAMPTAKHSNADAPSYCCTRKGENANTCKFDGCPVKESQRPKNTAIDQMNNAGDKATAGIGMLKDFTQEEIQDYKSKVNEYYAQAGNARLERREAFKIAEIAALIFAHNPELIDERRAVQSAAKLLSYAQEV